MNKKSNREIMVEKQKTKDFESERRNWSWCWLWFVDGGEKPLYIMVVLKGVGEDVDGNR